MDGSAKPHSPKTHSPKHLTTETMPPKPLSPKSRLRRLKELDKERKLLEAIEISPDDADEDQYENPKDEDQHEDQPDEDQHEDQPDEVPKDEDQHDEVPKDEDQHDEVPKDESQPDTAPNDLTKDEDQEDQQDQPNSKDQQDQSDSKDQQDDDDQQEASCITPRKKYTDEENLELQERVLKMKDEAQRFPEEIQKIIIEKWAAIDRQSTDNGIIVIAYERVLKEIREDIKKREEKLRKKYTDEVKEHDEAKQQEEAQLEEELDHAEKQEGPKYTKEQEEILRTIGEFANSLPKPTQTTFYKGLEEIRLQTPGDIDSRLRRFLYLKKTIEEKMKRQEEDVHLSEEEVQAEVAQTSAQSGNEEQDAEETEDENPTKPVKRGPGRPRKYPLQTPQVAKAKRGPGRPPKAQVSEKRGPGRPPKAQIPEKRGPGRPPKSVKRRPGRPRKTPSEEVQDSQPNTPESDAESQEASKRRHSDVSSISMSSNKKPRVAGTYSGPDSFSNSNLHL